MPTAISPHAIHHKQQYFDPYGSPSPKMTTFQPIQHTSGNDNGSHSNQMSYQNNQGIVVQQQQIHFYEKLPQVSSIPTQNYNLNVNQTSYQQRPSPPRHMNSWHQQRPQINVGNAPSLAHADPNMAFINHEATG